MEGWAVFQEWESLLAEIITGSESARVPGKFKGMGQGGDARGEELARKPVLFRGSRAGRAEPAPGRAPRVPGKQFSRTVLEDP